MSGDVVDAEDLFARLDRFGVEAVVIGGLAAVLHGSPTVTQDVDLCPEPSGINADRLAEALASMNARLRDAPAGLALPLDGPWLRSQQLVTLATDLGPIDVVWQPPGAPPYSRLRERAVVVDLGEARVRVASLGDLVAMKRATGRAKDQREVELLLAVAEERGVGLSAPEEPDADGRTSRGGESPV